MLSCVELYRITSSNFGIIRGYNQLIELLSTNDEGGVTADTTISISGSYVSRPWSIASRQASNIYPGYRIITAAPGYHSSYNCPIVIRVSRVGTKLLCPAQRN
ncbi:hypothetical protein ES703_66405 [subsurface metagenome]